MIRITPNETTEVIRITPSDKLDWSELPQIHFFMIDIGLRVENGATQGFAHSSGYFQVP